MTNFSEEAFEVRVVFARRSVCLCVCVYVCLCACGVSRELGGMESLALAVLRLTVKEQNTASGGED